MKNYLPIVLIILTIIFIDPTTAHGTTIKVHNNTCSPTTVCYTYVDHNETLWYHTKKIQPNDTACFQHLFTHKKNICIPGYPSLKVQSGKTISVSYLQMTQGNPCIPNRFYQLINDTDQTQEFVYHYTINSGGCYRSILLRSGEKKIFRHLGTPWIGEIQIRGHGRKTIKKGETWTASELLHV